MTRLLTLVLLLDTACYASVVLNWAGCHIQVDLDGVYKAQSGCWGQNQIDVPDTVRYVMFYTYNYHLYYHSNGYYYGLLASYDNGWSTADIQNWWCTYDGNLASKWWHRADFDESGWEKPTLIASNGDGPGYFSSISSSAKWIGIKYRTHHYYYCRHNLNNECPGFKLLPSVVIDHRIIQHGNSHGAHREVEMTCDITRTNDTSSNITGTTYASNVTYDVYVYIDDDLIKSYSGNNSLTPEDMPVRISEADGLRINSTLKCELYARNHTYNETAEFAGINETSLYNRSSETFCKRTASYYLGFEVVSNNLVAYEGGNSLKYEIRPTIPILCPVGSEDCEMVLTPVLKSLSQSPAVCSDGTSFDQLVYGSSLCGIVIGMTTNTTTTYSIDLAAAKDGIYDGDHNMEISFETPKSHSFHSLWQNSLSPVNKISVRDKDSVIREKACVAANDPHMTTFDGKRYEHQHEGEFVLYRHTSQPIEVQAYFKRCNAYATCVCGAAIRSGGQLFIYDQCREFKPHRIRLYECEGEGLTVTKLSGRHSYMIHLPTGGRVELYSYYIKVYPSASDLGKTEGLCGTLNGDITDDFMQRNGVVQTRVTSNGYYTYASTFSESWRVPSKESLYRGKLPSSSTTILKSNATSRYCTCHKNTTTGIFESQCGSMGETAVQFCTGQAKEETVKHTGRCLNRKKRALGTLSDDVDEDVELFKYDVNFVATAPSWGNGWTASTALTYCTNFLKNVDGTRTCIAENVGNIDEAIETCVADIQITGDTIYSTVHLQTFLSACVTEILKNMTYYSIVNDSSTGDKLVVRLPTVLLKDICPSNCNGRGTCVNGKCECRGNYVGEDCSDDKNKIPSLFELPGQGLCDTQQRPCKITPVNGDYFLEGDLLLCKIHVKKLMKNGEITELDFQIVQPEYDHWQRILCPLPPGESVLSMDVVAMNYRIAVSNDGSVYSDSVNLTVFDSMYTSCMPDLQCYLKFVNVTGSTPADDGDNTVIVAAVSVAVVIIILVIITAVGVCLKKTKYKGKPSRSVSSVSVDKPVEEKTKNQLTLSSTNLFVTEEYVGTNVAPLSTTFDFKRLRPKTGTRRNNQLDPLEINNPASPDCKSAAEISGAPTDAVSLSSTNIFLADEYVGTNVAPLSTTFDFQRLRPKTGTRRNNQLDPLEM